ncbi:unnamed protein product [Linum tenue]|uniref:Uncharacterized protein n=1 Tax=Linum tenue TaxID=586396 RepID=A0AAV0MSN5_9ROSI|nr:unnamed protein product [Linum tenue]
MSMARRSTSSSCSLFFIVVVLLVTALSTHHVNAGRALRSGALPIAGCDQVDGGESGAGIASFVASSNNSSGGNGDDYSVSLRGLMFRLASGPSKRGPGH